MKKALATLFLFSGLVVFANPWQMFSDVDDTYIYNQKTGEIYVRHKKGGKNYDDVFIKMSAGKTPDKVSEEVVAPNVESPSKESSESDRKKAIEKAMEIQKGLLKQAIE